MPEASGVRKHFEAILGREVEADGEVTLRERVSVYVEEKGRGASREIGTAGSSTKSCAARIALDVSGLARTGADGKAEFLLSDFHCHTDRIVFEYPTNLVATPRSRTPVFLTSVCSLTSDRKDVKIVIMAWDQAGAPAPRTGFDWRCRVPYLHVVD